MVSVQESKQREMSSPPFRYQSRLESTRKEVGLGTMQPGWRRVFVHGGRSRTVSLSATRMEGHSLRKQYDDYFVLPALLGRHLRSGGRRVSESLSGYCNFFLWYVAFILTPRIACPLDMFSEFFYPQRAAMFKDRIQAIANSDFERILEHSYEQGLLHNVHCVGVQWDYPLEDLVAVAKVCHMRLDLCVCYGRAGIWRTKVGFHLSTVRGRISRATRRLP